MGAAGGSGTEAAERHPGKTHHFIVNLPKHPSISKTRFTSTPFTAQSTAPFHPGLRLGTGDCPFWMPAQLSSAGLPCGPRDRQRWAGCPQGSQDLKRLGEKEG